MRLFALAILALSCTARAESAKPKPPEEYTLTAATTPAPVTAGSESRFVITIAAKKPWVFKATTPLKVTLSAGDGVKLSKSELDSKDIVDEKADPKSVGVGFTAAKGDYKISADLSFFLCTDELCKRYTDKLQYPLSVR